MTDPAGDYGFDLSPDGSRLAVNSRQQNHIRILFVDGSAPRDIQAKRWAAVNTLDWAADGNGFFCGNQSPQGATLLHIDLEGNARALWRQKGSDGIHGVPSPDGKHLAIPAFTSESTVRMIENF